jgi:hypothetical protein
MVQAGWEELRRVMEEMGAFDGDRSAVEENMAGGDFAAARIYEAMVGAFRRGEGNWQPW